MARKRMNEALDAARAIEAANAVIVKAQKAVDELKQYEGRQLQVLWIENGRGELEPATLDAILHENLQSLRSDRLNEDQPIIDWVASLDDNSLNGSFTFTPMTNPVEVTQKLAPCLTHFFNHQTHHRGQIHAMLTAAGAKPDDTDIAIMPAKFAAM